MKLGMKSVVAMVISLSATAALAGAALSVTEVNERVAELLTPFNNESTEARVKFMDLEINKVNVLKFGVRGHFAKTGKVNSLKLHLPNVNYVYDGPNGLPRIDAEIMLEMDFLKSFPQNFLNATADDAENMVKDIAKDFLKEYGDAAAVTTDADITRSEAGNVIAMKISIDGAVDLTKLPESVPVNEAPVVNFKINISADLQGASLGLSGELNPKYKGFNEDSAGLKELIEGLLNNDKATYEQISQIVGYVDGFATDMVNRSPDN